MARGAKRESPPSGKPSAPGRAGASPPKSVEEAKARRPPGEKCELCGHWSLSTEYGIDDRSGYCDRWEKLTSRDFWCAEFIDRGEFAKYQRQLAEDSGEEGMDEET